MKKAAPGPMPSGTVHVTGPLGVVTVTVLPAVALAGHTTCICCTPSGSVGVGGARGGVPDRDDGPSFSSAELRASGASASFMRSGCGSGSAMLRKHTHAHAYDPKKIRWRCSSSSKTRAALA